MIQEQIITTIDEIQKLLAKTLVIDVIAEGGAGSGHWGHKGRKGQRGGSIGGGGKAFRPKVFWKPTMTAAESSQWFKNSKLKDTYIHGTTEESVESIKKNGFDLSKKRYGRAYGDGVYMSSEEEVRKKGLSYGSSRLRIRINVKNPLIDMDGSIMNTNSSLANEMDAYAKKHKIDIYAKENDTVAYKKNVVSVYLKKKGYDSVVTEEEGAQVVVVFNPKNVTVLK